MVKCESLRINMYRITHTGKSVNFPVTLLSKEKPTTSVTEWANASKQEFNNIERTRSDRQEAQKEKAREIFGHILKE